MNLPRILWWLDLLFLIAGGLIAASTLAVWISRRRDPLRGAALRPNHLNLTAVWLCVTAYFLGAVAGSSLGARLTASVADEGKRQEWAGIIGANIGALTSIVVCLIVARQMFHGGWRGLGLGRRPFARDLAIALPAWLASLTVCSGIAWVTQKLMQAVIRDFTPPQHSVFDALEDAAAPVLIRLLAFTGALLLAPLSEELLFRGILQTAARRLFPAKRHHLHRWGSILAIAVLFGAMHLTTPHHVPALVVFGAILGYLYERSGSLTLPILVHLLFNAKSLIWYLLIHR